MPRRRTSQGSRPRCCQTSPVLLRRLGWSPPRRITLIGGEAADTTAPNAGASAWYAGWALDCPYHNVGVRKMGGLTCGRNWGVVTMGVTTGETMVCSDDGGASR